MTWTPAFLLSASRINHGLVDSPLPAGPGLTTDESINLQQGIYLFDAFSQHGPLMALPGAAQEVYGSPDYMPDYVPLGRFLLGMSHELTAWLIPGAELSAASIPAARLASSTAFALTTLLLVLFTGRHYGSATAITAGVLFLLMPRVIGHSRIASLETITSLAWFASLLPLLAWWTRDRPPTPAQAAISGLLWGLLMLVKIQAVFLPPVITVYAFWQLRLRALVPLSIMAIIGLTVFFAGWPWLWLDPFQNVKSYLMSTTDRLVVNNWYLAHRFADKSTPWHYPFVLTAATLPVHCLICVGLRLLKRRFDAAEQLLLCSVLIPMAAFALPGTPVYDGVRLFLFVTPAIAVLAGRGLMLFVVGGEDAAEPDGGAVSSGRSWLKRPAVVIAGGLLLIDVALTVPRLGPFAGDCYNSVVRLLPTEPETFEASYWEDALNGDFWQQVPADSTIAVAPVLHGVRLQDMMSMIPLVQERNIRLEPFYYKPSEQRGLVLLLHRLADLPPQLRQPPPGNTPLIEVRQDGRVLARLVDTTETTWQEKPQWPAGQ